MRAKTLIGTLALGIVCSAAAARVVRLEITKGEPAPARRQATMPYERISGKCYGELDPKDPKNALITDIQLAPRNARGMVEYVGTFSLMKPVDMSLSSGV